MVGPQLMSIHHRLSVLAGDRLGIRPPQIRLKKEYDHIRHQAQVVVRARWPRSSNACQRVLSAAGWQLPLPDRLRAHFPVYHNGLAPTAACPLSVMLRSELQTVAPCRVVCVFSPPATVVRAAWES